MLRRTVNIFRRQGADAIVFVVFISMLHTKRINTFNIISFCFVLFVCTFVVRELKRKRALLRSNPPGIDSPL